MNGREMDKALTVDQESSRDRTGDQSSTEKALETDVIDAIRECYDPEIPVNVYDLGLIYDVLVSSDARVEVVMTLTTPHCPVAEILPDQVKSRVEQVEGVDEVSLELTWDPPWNPGMMSEAAKLELGFL